MMLEQGITYLMHLNVSENSLIGFRKEFGFIVVRNHIYENLDFSILVSVETSYSYPSSIR